MTDPRRSIPRTDTVLADPRLVAASVRLGPETVTQAVRAAQARARAGEIPPLDVADTAVDALPETLSTMRSALNATGIVLHTNLGRAPLSQGALDAIGAVARYADVEYDLESGRRGRRGRGPLEALLARVPAAEDAHVVNNGAAAVVLAATALAAGREIVLSRGEMVEIGDGFRIPDLIASTGARLHEVGTTNRTHLSDYADAIGPDTGFVLKIHTSNFRVEGFTAASSVAELATLGVPVIADIGSGLLAPDPLLPSEPDAATSLRDGAAIVTASGDKLLGGPQAGLLLGRRDVLHTLRRHPLARALRPDKLTLAALEATLRDPATPTHVALHTRPEDLHARADALAQALTSNGLPAEVTPSDGAVGGGGAPGMTLPGWAVRLPEAYAYQLRQGRPTVISRLEHGYCLVDLRCIPVADDGALGAAILAAAARCAGMGR